MSDEHEEVIAPVDEPSKTPKKRPWRFSFNILSPFVTGKAEAEIHNGEQIQWKILWKIAWRIALALGVLAGLIERLINYLIP